MERIKNTHSRMMAHINPILKHYHRHKTSDRYILTLIKDIHRYMSGAAPYLMRNNREGYAIFVATTRVVSAINQIARSTNIVAPMRAVCVPQRKPTCPKCDEELVVVCETSVNCGVCGFCAMTQDISTTSHQRNVPTPSTSFHRHLQYAQGSDAAGTLPPDLLKNIRKDLNTYGRFNVIRWLRVNNHHSYVNQAVRIVAVLTDVALPQLTSAEEHKLVEMFDEMADIHGYLYPGSSFSHRYFAYKLLCQIGRADVAANVRLPSRKTLIKLDVRYMKVCRASNGLFDYAPTEHVCAPRSKNKVMINESI